MWLLGMDTSVDIVAQSFQSLDFGSNFISDKFTSSFNSYNKGDLLKICFHQSVRNYAYAVEVSRMRSTNNNRITMSYDYLDMINVSKSSFFFFLMHPDLIRITKILSYCKRISWNHLIRKWDIFFIIIHMRFLKFYGNSLVINVFKSSFILFRLESWKYYHISKHDKVIIHWVMILDKVEYFRRDEEELMVLRGFIDYKLDPWDDMKVLYEQLKSSTAFQFDNTHEQKLFDLSIFVWGDIETKNKVEPKISEESVSVVESW